MQEGNLDKVNKLLTKKRNSVSQDRIFDQRNEQGHAPLHIACVLGYMLVTKHIVAVFIMLWLVIMSSFLWNMELM